MNKKRYFLCILCIPFFTFSMDAFCPVCNSSFATADELQSHKMAISHYHAVVKRLTTGAYKPRKPLAIQPPIKKEPKELRVKNREKMHREVATVFYHATKQRSTIVIQSVTHQVAPVAQSASGTDSSSAQIR